MLGSGICLLSFKWHPHLAFSCYHYVNFYSGSFCCFCYFTVSNYSNNYSASFSKECHLNCHSKQIYSNMEVNCPSEKGKDKKALYTSKSNYCMGVPATGLLFNGSRLVTRLRHQQQTSMNEIFT